LKLTVKKDSGSFNSIASELKKLRQGYVKAGVLASDKEREDGEVSNVDLAIIHEFGAPAANIPERSFVRSTFARNRDKYSAALKKLAENIFTHPRSAEDILGLVGAKMAADMKQTIADGIEPPNSPAVAARKAAKGRGPGAPKPLVDTGQLLNSISWEVSTSKKKG